MLGEALSSSTRTTYSSGVHQYLDFCFAHNLATKENLLLAPTEENLVYFVASLQGKVQYQTVKLYLAAIANFYVEQSMPLQTDNMYQLHRILKGIKRTSSSQQRTRRPITIQILSQISDLLRPAFSPELDTVMLWAAFTLAFFGFYELANLPIQAQNPSSQLKTSPLCLISTTQITFKFELSSLKQTHFARVLH